MNIIEELQTHGIKGEMIGTVSVGWLIAVVCHEEEDGSELELLSKNYFTFTRAYVTECRFGGGVLDECQNLLANAISVGADWFEMNNVFLVHQMSPGQK